LADAILECLADTGREIVEQGGDPERVERVVAAIDSNTRKAGTP